MNTRPIALLLTPVVPTRSGSGLAMRAYSWAVQLSRFYQLKVILVSAVDQVAQKTEPFEILCFPGRVSQTPKWRIAISMLWPMLGKSCAQSWLWFDNDLFSTWIRSVVTEPVARAVVFRLYLHDAAVLTRESISISSMEVDLDDLESTTRESISRAYFRQRQWFRAWCSRWSAKQYSRFERTIVPTYERIWLAAEEDIGRLPSQAHPRSGQFPNRIAPAINSASVDLEIPAKQKSVHFVFVGTLNYVPNVDALHYLVEQVLPQLRQLTSLPWKLMVAGRDARPKLVRRLNSVPEIDFLGELEEVGSLLRQATAALVPLRAGGGTKLKTIEAFAHGCPVISTYEGVRGLGAESGTHFLLGETALEFAVACNRLAEDQGLANQLARNAQKLYERKFMLAQ